VRVLLASVNGDNLSNRNRSGGRDILHAGDFCGSAFASGDRRRVKIPRYFDSFPKENVTSSVQARLDSDHETHTHSQHIVVCFGSYGIRPG